MLLEYLIGVQVIPKPPPTNPNAREFDINDYPKVARRGGQKVTRKLESAAVQFGSESVFKDNLLQTVDWKKAVNIPSELLERYSKMQTSVHFSVCCTIFPV